MSLSKEQIDINIQRAIDEVFNYYESDHGLRSIRYIHPMFYNGTFCKDNCYQPEEPETLLTKEEFTDKITEEPWNTAFQVMFNFISREHEIL